VQAQAFSELEVALNGDVQNMQGHQWASKAHWTQIEFVSSFAVAWAGPLVTTLQPVPHRYTFPRLKAYRIWNPSQPQTWLI